MKILFAFLLCIISTLGFSQTFNSLPGTHNWNDSSAWDLGYPPDGLAFPSTQKDTINIVNNSTLLISGNLYLYDDPIINIEAGGTLQNNGNVEISFEGLSEIHNYGNIALDTNLNTRINVLTGYYKGYTGSNLAANYFYLNPFTDTSFNYGNIVCKTFYNEGGWFYNYGNIFSRDIYVVNYFYNYGNIECLGDLTYSSAGASEMFNTGSLIIEGSLTTGNEFKSISSDTIFVNEHVNIEGDFISDSPIKVAGWGGISTYSSGDSIVFNNFVTTQYLTLSNSDICIITDSVYINNNFYQSTSGTTYVDGGIIYINNNFENNHGLITGDNNGKYIIAQQSQNIGFPGPTETITGNIYFCDLTLVPGTYVDINTGILDTSTVTFCGNFATGIEEQSLMEVNVYPNPVADVLFIHASEKSSVSLYDVRGTLIYSSSISPNNQQIDLSNLEKGIYFLKVENSKGVLNERLIKL